MKTSGSGRRGIAGFLVAVTTTALALVPGTSPSSAKPKWAHPEAPGGRGMAHRADARRVSPKGLHVPKGVIYDTGLDAGEPTVGTAKDGTVYFVGANIDAEPVINQVDVTRSEDDGKTWTVMSPRTGPQNNHPITLDPMIWLDETTSRLYTIDLTVACSIMSYTDDKGETWITNPLACGRPVNDHQTLFGGPPATSITVGYPNVLYYCWNDIASSSCGKSIDGGLTWRATGTPAFVGYEQGEQGEGGLCGGLHGHGVVGPDGTVYLPREYCNRPYVAISHDEGATWDTVQVAGIRHEDGSDPSVAVDRKGNLYYTWIGPKRLVYLVTSTDGGETWSKPLMVSAPGVIEANIPTIDAVEPGKIAIAYYGSENSPGKPWNESYLETTWNVYITMSVDALDDDPVFYSAPVNDRRNPLVRDRCGPGRCKRVFDFIDVEIAPDGTPWAALVDHCIEQPFNNNPKFNCVTKPVGGTSYGDRGLVGRLVGGPRLR